MKIIDAASIVDPELRHQKRLTENETTQIRKSNTTFDCYKINCTRSAQVNVSEPKTRQTISASKNHKSMEMNRSCFRMIVFFLLQHRCKLLI